MRGLEVLNTLLKSVVQLVDVVESCVCELAKRMHRFQVLLRVQPQPLGMQGRTDLKNGYVQSGPQGLGMERKDTGTHRTGQTQVEGKQCDELRLNEHSCNQAQKGTSV